VRSQATKTATPPIIRQGGKARLAQRRAESASVARHEIAMARRVDFLACAAVYRFHRRFMFFKFWFRR
jgi:hypothetical protein